MSMRHICVAWTAFLVVSAGLSMANAASSGNKKPQNRSKSPGSQQSLAQQIARVRQQLDAARRRVESARKQADAAKKAIQQIKPQYQAAAENARQIEDRIRQLSQRMRDAEEAVDQQYANDPDYRKLKESREAALAALRREEQRVLESPQLQQKLTAVQGDDQRADQLKRDALDADVDYQVALQRWKEADAAFQQLRRKLLADDVTWSSAAEQWRAARQELATAEGAVRGKASDLHAAEERLEQANETIRQGERTIAQLEAALKRLEAQQRGARPPQGKTGSGKKPQKQNGRRP